MAEKKVTGKLLETLRSAPEAVQQEWLKRHPDLAEGLTKFLGAAKEVQDKFIQDRGGAGVVRAALSTAAKEAVKATGPGRMATEFGERKSEIVEFGRQLRDEKEPFEVASKIVSGAIDQSSDFISEGIEEIKAAPSGAISGASLAKTAAGFVPIIGPAIYEDAKLFAEDPWRGFGAFGSYFPFGGPVLGAFSKALQIAAPKAVPGGVRRIAPTPAAAAAKRQDIPLTAGETLPEGHFIGRLEHSALKTARGRSLTEPFFQGRIAKAREYANRLEESFASRPFDPDEIRNIAQRNLETSRTAQLNEFDQLARDLTGREALDEYDVGQLVVDALNNKQIAPVLYQQRGYDELFDVIRERGINVTFDAITKHDLQLLGRVLGNDPVGKAAYDKLTTAVAKGETALAFESIKQIRTTIGAQIGARKATGAPADATTGALKDLYGALTDDMAAALTPHADLNKAWRGLGQINTQKNKLFNKQFVRAMLRSPDPMAPELIMTRLLGKGSPQNVDAILKIVQGDPQMTTALSRGALDHLATKATDISKVPGVASDAVNYDVMLRELIRIPAYRRILGTRNYAQVREFVQNKRRTTMSADDILFDDFLQKAANPLSIKPWQLVGKALKDRDLAKSLARSTPDQPSLAAAAYHELLDQASEGGAWATGGSKFNPLQFAKLFREHRAALKNMTTKEQFGAMEEFATVMGALKNQPIDAVFQGTTPARDVGRFMTLAAPLRVQMAMKAGLAIRPAPFIKGIMLNPERAKLFAQGFKRFPNAARRANWAETMFNVLGQARQGELRPEQIEERQLGIEAIMEGVERMISDRSLSSAIIDPITGKTQLGAAQVALGGLQTALSPLAPAFRSIQNFGRASVAANLLGDTSQLDKLGNLAGDDRPTTGSFAGDLATDVFSEAITDPFMAAKAVAGGLAIVGSRGLKLVRNKAGKLERLSLTPPPSGERIGPLRVNVPDPLAEQRINTAAKRKPEVGERNNQRFRLENPHEGRAPFIIGKPTTDDFIERWSYLSADEFQRARTWYRDLRGMFAAQFGEQNADWELFQWLISQQQTSPSTGMQFVQRAQDVAEGRRTADQLEALPSIKGKGLGLAGPRLLKAAKGEMPSKTIGTKLMDFVDAAMEKVTRTWMGDDPRGGSAAPIDTWAFAGMGYLTKAFRTRLEKTFPGLKKLGKLVDDSKDNAPSTSQYHRALIDYNELTADLNARGYKGITDLNPREAQAIDWVAFQKSFGIQPEFPEDIFIKNTRRLSFENVSFADGSPYGEMFPQLAEQPLIVQRAITEDILNNPVFDELAKEIGGTIERRIVGNGGWESVEFKASGATGSGHIDLISSPETADDFMDAVGYIFQQNAVVGWRPLKTGKRTGLVVTQLGGEDQLLGDTNRVWRQLESQFDWLRGKVKGEEKGWSPNRVDGMHAIWLERQTGRGDLAADMPSMVIADLTPTQAKQLEEAIGHMDNIDAEFSTATFNHEFKKSTTKWSETNGQDYKARLDARGRTDLSARLDSHYQPRIEQAIREAWEKNAPQALVRRSPSPEDPLARTGVAGAESRRTTDPHSGAPLRHNFYALNAPQEASVVNAARFEHLTEPISPAQIYDIASDPKGYIDRARTPSGGVDPNVLEQLIEADPDFVGYKNSARSDAIIAVFDSKTPQFQPLAAP